VKRQNPALSKTLKEEFQKDLDLFKRFLLLLNNAGPIRNVELFWNEELDPAKPKFKNRVGTEDALVQLQPAGSEGGNRNAPSTLFCDLVHGFGAHEDQTCARSDIPAQQRCRATGCTQVYACHVGLTDIAVPITCDGQYLGTLFSGQVLTAPPTRQGFKQVHERLNSQGHIDFAELEKAYFNVPVVTEAQVSEMVKVLELFARYIANSWKRLQIMAEFQRTHDRELALNRKELASVLLAGEMLDRNELLDLASRAGVHRIPDRVLVLQVSQALAPETRMEISNHQNLNRLLHIVEDVCATWPNTLAASVRPGEICVLTSHELRNPGHERISLKEMAQTMLAEIGVRSAVGVRVGISKAHQQASELVHAYQEAIAALGSSNEVICLFDEPAQRAKKPVEALERLIKTVRDGLDASTALRDFLTCAVPPDHSPPLLQQSRALLTWAIEHLALEVVTGSADQPSLAMAKERAITSILHAPTPFVACEAFRKFAEFLCEQVASTFSQREQKIVLAVRKLTEQRGAASITIQELASALHLSAGHLSRVFRRTAGMTLEHYLILQRVDLAKRALLDPRFNVSEVAERCGFCNPAYFASVFRKYVKCTPREFAMQPHRWTPVDSLAMVFEQDSAYRHPLQDLKRAEN
jgi:AraC-like DNA-binding protein/ligand-binding sensor protein